MDTGGKGKRRWDSSRKRKKEGGGTLLQTQEGGRRETGGRFMSPTLSGMACEEREREKGEGYRDVVRLEGGTEEDR